MRAWLHRRIHISWIVAAVSGGLILGAGVVPAVTVVSAQLWWLLPAALLLFIAFRRRSRLFLCLAIFAGLIIGFWRGSLELHDLSAFRPYYGSPVTIQGTVSEDVVYIAPDEQRIRIHEVSIAGQRLRGTVWVSSSSKTNEIKRGDRLQVDGELAEGFGNFPAAMFRAKVTAIERPQPGDVARQMRDWFAEHVRHAIDEPEASLGIGFLTGQQSTLPEVMSAQLQLLGLTHIVVASGYNLTILVRLARRLFQRISKYMATIFSGLLTAGFVLVTGFSASMNRAALVTGLSLVAWYYGRRVHPVVLLLVVACVTVLASPSVLWGDLGWYLSFTSFAGVIVLAPLVHTYFWGEGRPGFLRQILVDTSAAQLATLPIVLFAFGQFSPLSLLANLLILPLVPFAMLLVFLAGIATAIIPGAAAFTGLPAELILAYMTSVIDWLAALPFAQIEIDSSPLILVLGYAALIFVGFWLKHKTKHTFSNENGSI